MALRAAATAAEVNEEVEKGGAACGDENYIVYRSTCQHFPRRREASPRQCMARHSSTRTVNTRVVHNRVNRYETAAAPEAPKQTELKSGNSFMFAL